MPGTAYPGSFARLIGDKIGEQRSVFDWLSDQSIASAVQERTYAGDFAPHFQDALDRMGTRGGGHLFMPRGLYLLGSEVTYPSNIRIHGEGARSEIINATGRTGGVYRLLIPAATG